jgi:hypothetical protein
MMDIMRLTIENGLQTEHHPAQFRSGQPGKVQALYDASAKQRVTRA